MRGVKGGAKPSLAQAGMGRRVIGFYGHARDKAFREFSNFYNRSPTFEFELPEFARDPRFPRSVSCEFSEKAIMVTKAALMGDVSTFHKIVASKSPEDVKAWGRYVKPWNEALWMKHLEEVAFEAVRQKFSADRRLREILLSTGDDILAEATRNDRIWGIGIDIGDPRVQDPARWQGRNVLGQALMRVREHLRGGHQSGKGHAAEEQEPTRSKGSKGSGKGYPAGSATSAAPSASTVIAGARSPGAPELRFFVVMDFEATCWDGGQEVWQQEIIEFPAVLLDATTLTPVAEFREFVKPTRYPQLSSYCTELTGIQQADVDGADGLPRVLQRFGAWLDGHGLDVDPAAALPVTCGDYDLGRMLQSEASQKRLEYHPTLWWWCNVKVPFAEKFGRPMGMKAMLGQLGLRLIGKHHSGIDDARNISKIVQALIQSHGACIKTTSGSRPRAVASSRVTGDERRVPGMAGGKATVADVAARPAAPETTASASISGKESAEPAKVSALSEEEKEFLKIAKKVRAILKIEAHVAAGASGVDRLQEQKLAGKGEELKKLAEAAYNLHRSSPLREKNADVLAALT